MLDNQILFIFVQMVDMIYSLNPIWMCLCSKCTQKPTQRPIFSLTLSTFSVGNFVFVSLSSIPGYGFLFISLKLSQNQLDFLNSIHTRTYKTSNVHRSIMIDRFSFQSEVFLLLLCDFCKFMVP